MRRYTLQYIQKLVEARPQLELGTPRRPSPMPGKNWPTRVAWHFELADRSFRKNPETGKLQVHYTNHRSLSYTGKPSRYRALEVRKLLKLCTPFDKPIIAGSTVLMHGWQAEFDKAGLTAYKVVDMEEGSHRLALPSFYAYHPHSSDTEIVEAFSKPLFVKYIGGMRVYSQKRKLSQEAVDAYYSWYQEQFKRKLRRPKAIPTAIVGGELVQSEEQQ